MTDVVGKTSRQTSKTLQKAIDVSLQNSLYTNFATTKISKTISLYSKKNCKLIIRDRVCCFSVTEKTRLRNDEKRISNLGSTFHEFTSFLLYLATFLFSIYLRFSFFRKRAAERVSCQLGPYLNCCDLFSYMDSYI